MCIDYPIAIWAVHRVGGIISYVSLLTLYMRLTHSCYRGANPDFGSDELLYQIQISNAKLILVHPDALETAVSAARSAGISLDRVVAFNIASKRTPEGFQSVSDLVRAGLDQETNFVEPNIDARTKLAFLSFSSGML